MIAVQGLYFSMYSAARSFLKVFSELMYRILPKIGRSGPQGLSYRPSTHMIPV